MSYGYKMKILLSLYQFSFASESLILPGWQEFPQLLSLGHSFLFIYLFVEIQPLSLYADLLVRAQAGLEHTEI